MIKVTIESDGKEPHIIEGDWICGTVFQNEDFSCTANSLLIGDVVEIFLPQLLARNIITILKDYYPEEELDNKYYLFKKTAEMLMNGEKC